MRLDEEDAPRHASSRFSTSPPRPDFAAARAPSAAFAPEPSPSVKRIVARAEAAGSGSPGLIEQPAPSPAMTTPQSPRAAVRAALLAVMQGAVLAELLDSAREAFAVWYMLTTQPYAEAPRTPLSGAAAEVEEGLEDDQALWHPAPWRRARR